MSTNRPSSRDEPAPLLAEAVNDRPAGYQFTANERWTLVLLIGAMLYIIVLALRSDGVWAPDICPMHRGLGLNCPGCGLTRAAVALTRLDPWLAVRLNPLIVFVAGYVIYRGASIGWGLATGRVLVARWPRWWLISVQVALLAVGITLATVRLATWLNPDWNPAGWGVPPR
jgi:hypothetical protein